MSTPCPETQRYFVPYWFNLLEPTGPCCSARTCSPELLNLIKVSGLRQTQPQLKKAPKKGVPHLQSQQDLTAWRSQIWYRDHSGASWGSSGILSDDLVDFLASVGPIVDHKALGHLIAHRWGWWEEYGHELADLVAQLHTPYTPTLPKSRSSHKRKASTALGNAPQEPGSPLGPAQVDSHSASAITQPGRSNTLSDGSPAPAKTRRTEGASIRNTAGK